MMDKPHELGYRMPAEWARHAATWIAWPRNRDDWPGKFAPIPWVYTEIVRVVSRVEPVQIVVPGRASRRRVQDQLDEAGVDLEGVRFWKAKTDRVWMRDSAPTFVTRRQGSVPAVAENLSNTPDQVALVGWKFNGWAKYDDHRNDAQTPRRMASWLDLPLFTPRVDQAGKSVRVVMEGGAIDVNGRGTLMATEECLHSKVQERNPGLDRAGLERVFADYLGVRNVVWLGQGIAGDDTHGHIDDLARFVDERTVVVVVEPRRGDPNHEPLEDNVHRLKAARDQDGEPLSIVELPMPAPVVFGGERLPASYANFYIANGLVVVPTFNDPADRVALNILAGLFPGREVVGIHAVDLVLGLGTLHCLTQQQPLAPST